MTSCAFACGIALLTASPAGAQAPAWGDRAFINANVARQLDARRFGETLTPTIYAEPATIVTSHAIEPGWLPIDVGGGVRLFGNFGAGATYTQFAFTELATVSADVPHPTLFNRPRLATKVAEMAHAETLLHLQAVWVQPLSQKLDLALSGGPSIAMVKQDFVSGIKVAEAPPTAVAISEVTIVKESGRGRGYNAAADLTYFVTPMAGVGLSIRYTSATVTLRQGSAGSISLDAGGLRLGVGARIRLK